MVAPPWPRLRAATPQWHVAECAAGSAARTAWHEGCRIGCDFGPPAQEIKREQPRRVACMACMSNFRPVFPVIVASGNSMPLELDPSRVTSGPPRAVVTSLHGLDILFRRTAGWLSRFGLQRPLNGSDVRDTKTMHIAHTNREEEGGHTNYCRKL